MPAKPWWQSKTVWTNVIALITALGLWAQTGGGMTNLMAMVLPALLAIVNVVLRMVTNQPIE